MPTAKKGAKKATGRSRAGKPLASVVEISKTPFDPQEFYNSTDWEDWYHEFATAQSRSGTPKYVSAFEFAKLHGKTRQERDLILYVIGPVVAGKAPLYKNIAQWDWEKRRKTGFWLGPETIKTQLAEITQHTDTLAELRASGQTYLLPLLAQISGMFEKIEASFSGQLFLPNASTAANDARANLYMRLVDQVTKLTIQLQEAYARSLFMNINDMQGTLAVRDSVAAQKETHAAKTSKSHEFLRNVIEMTFEKAEALKMPLPDADIVQVASRNAVGR